MLPSNGDVALGGLWVRVHVITTNTTRRNMILDKYLIRIKGNHGTRVCCDWWVPRSLDAGAQGPRSHVRKWARGQEECYQEPGCLEAIGP